MESRKDIKKELMDVRKDVAVKKITPIATAILQLVRSIDEFTDELTKSRNAQLEEDIGRLKAFAKTMSDISTAACDSNDEETLKNLMKPLVDEINFFVERMPMILKENLSNSPAPELLSLRGKFFVESFSKVKTFIESPTTKSLQNNVYAGSSAALPRMNNSVSSTIEILECFQIEKADCELKSVIGDDLVRIQEIQMRLMQRMKTIASSPENMIARSDELYCCQEIMILMDDIIVGLVNQIDPSVSMIHKKLVAEREKFQEELSLLSTASITQSKVLQVVNDLNLSIRRLQGSDTSAWKNLDPNGRTKAQEVVLKLVENGTLLIRFFISSSPTLQTDKSQRTFRKN